MNKFITFGQVVTSSVMERSFYVAVYLKFKKRQLIENLIHIVLSKHSPQSIDIIYRVKFSNFKSFPVMKFPITIPNTSTLPYHNYTNISNKIPVSENVSPPVYPFK